MAVKGFQGTSLLDYPGRLASLVFFDRCNLLCPFCHNPDLVLRPESLPDYPAEVLFDDLSERRDFIDGVVITGGEPTLARDLTRFIRRIKSLDLLVKLDTNGLRPEVTEPLVAGGLIDYLALDLKTSPGRYGELGWSGDAEGRLRETLAQMRLGTIESEVRTTCVPSLVRGCEIAEIGALVEGIDLWALQQYQPASALDPDWRNLNPLPKTALEKMAEAARGYARQVIIRGA